MRAVASRSTGNARRDDSAQQKGDIPTVERGVNYLKRAVATDIAALQRRSPVYKADKITAAVVLIHGKDDERAPFEHAKRLRARWRKPAIHPNGSRNGATARDSSRKATAREPTSKCWRSSTSTSDNGGADFARLAHEVRISDWAVRESNARPTD